jgi:acyl-CoA synthetase (AMP-forming)/AMP-acid ligase II
MFIIRGVNVYPSEVETALLAVEGTLPHYQIVLARARGLDRTAVEVEVTPGVFSDKVRALEDAVLVVEPDRVLSGTIALQFLEAQAGKPQGLQGHGRVHAVQDLGATGVKVSRQGSAGRIRVLAIENILGTLAAE